MRALPSPGITKPHWRLESLQISSLTLWLGGIMLVALALRLIWVFFTDTIPLGGDPHWYYVVGINIAKGFGFVASRNELHEITGPGEPTAFWPPGYPFALGALFKVFGVSLTSAQVLNAVLGALTVPFIYALGQRMFTRSVGLVSAGLFAIFPNVIAGTPLLFPEPLFGLLFVAAIWLLVARMSGPHQPWLPLAAFGLLVGMATLTRGQGAVLVPVAALYWLMRAGWQPALRSTVIACVVAAATIAPWTIRNAVELHAFIPISTNSGAALRVGHNAEATGSTGWTDDEIDGFHMWESLYRPDWEVKGYREYTDLAINYALTHPLREVELSARKVYHLYRSDATVIPWLTTLDATPIEPQVLEDALWYVFDVWWYTLLFAVVALTPFWLRRDPDRWLLMNIIIIWTLFHVAFLAEPRYHIPLYPVLIIAAVGGAATALPLLRRALDRWRAFRPASP